MTTQTQRTAQELLANDNGYGFFGAANGLLGMRQAALAYNAAVRAVMMGKVSQADAEKFLTSKPARWWAECLNPMADYGQTETECQLQVSRAWGGTRMQPLQMVVAKTLREWQD